MPAEIERLKFPRTSHLPWSPGFTGDDVRWVVVTEKMDGENVTLYPDGSFHARSVDSAHHQSRDWLARRHRTEIAPAMPRGFRICAEYMRATHAIYYPDLADYLLVHSIWDGPNCLAWEDTMLYCALLNLTTVPVWDVRSYDEEMFKLIYPREAAGREVEGYVVRRAASFPYSEYQNCVAKWVRASHVPPGTPHWQRGPLRLNRLATTIF
jgi:hypothetical protein